MELQKLVSSIKVLVVSTCAGNPGSLAGIRIVYRAQKRFWNPIRARMMPSRPLSSLLATLLGVVAKGTHPRVCHIIKPDMRMPSFQDAYAQAMEAACSACIEAPPM